MGADFDFIKGAVIAVLAVICAVVYAASDVLVSFIHGLIPPIRFVVILSGFF